MKIRFGGIVFTFDVNAERTWVTIDRPEEYGFSGEGRDMSTSVINAVKNVLESQIENAIDYDIQELAIESLACAYAAGVMKDFEAISDTMFMYRGAIYYVESILGQCDAYRYIDDTKVSLSAFVLRREDKTWMGVAQSVAHQEEEKRNKAIEEFLDGPGYDQWLASGCDAI